MAMVTLNQKGQVSIEFILIVTIALIYVNAVVWPTVESSSQAAIDVKAVSDTKVSAMKLANAINEAETSSGNMKKTVNVFIPKDAKITITKNVNTISHETMVSYMNNFNPMEKIGNIGCDPVLDPSGNTIGFLCISSVEILTTASNNLLLPTNPNPFEIKGPRFGQIEVEKTDTTISVDWKT